MKPQVGDEWEVRRPGKRKLVKRIGRVYRRYVYAHTLGSTQRRVPYVNWERQPKGRYSGIRVKDLLKYGKRLSTAAEREAAQSARWKRLGI